MIKILIFSLALMTMANAQTFHATYGEAVTEHCNNKITLTAQPAFDYTLITATSQKPLTFWMHYTTGVLLASCERTNLCSARWLHETMFNEGRANPEVTEIELVLTTQEMACVGGITFTIDRDDGEAVPVPPPTNGSGKPPGKPKGKSGK